MYHRLLLTLLFVTFAASCSKNDDLSNEIELTVASKKVMSKDENGVEKERNVVREQGGQWKILFGLMPYFQYEDGYEYQLKVQKIVSSPNEKDNYASYALISQISKEKRATVFESRTYSITNNAKAEGENLTPDEISTIEQKIKQSSFFAGITYLTFQYMDFYVADAPLKKFIYKTNTAKTGNGNLTVKEDDGNAISVCTFDFEGKSVNYEYGFSTSPGYLILDLTSEYKTDYPALESAQSRIVIKGMI